MKIKGEGKMSEKILFLKYHDITVGLLNVENNIPKQLEILRPDLFFVLYGKLFW